MAQHQYQTLLTSVSRERLHSLLVSLTFSHIILFPKLPLSKQFPHPALVSMFWRTAWCYESAHSNQFKCHNPTCAGDLCPNKSVLPYCPPNRHFCTQFIIIRPMQLMQYWKLMAHVMIIPQSIFNASGKRLVRSFCLSVRPCMSDGIEQLGSPLARLS